MRVQRRGPAGIWGRRLVAIPVFMTATVVAVVALPLIVVAALISDAVRRAGGMRITRTALLVVALMIVECFGLLAAFGVWVVTGFGLARGAFLSLSSSLQVAWAALHFGMAMRMFRVRIDIEGLESLTPGPILIFMRHTSLADALAPAKLIARPTGLRPRYVMKRELLWGPGINVMGTRTPNCFVRRGSGGESRFVGLLAEDLGPGEAVLIYPEGMVLTPAKAAALAGSEKAGPGGSRGSRGSRGYERVNPPRLGGPLALLERARGRYDVAFVGHVGLEVAPGTHQLLRGDLLDARVRFRMWRTPASSIPATRPGMAQWLNERWHEMDDWVAKTQDEMGVRTARP